MTAKPILKFYATSLLLPGLSILISLLNSPCCAQVLSNLQSARMANKNHFELTPMFSTVDAVDHDKTIHLQNEFGLHAEIGLSEKISICVRPELISSEGSDYYSTTFFIGLGPKISLMENNIAISLPVGTGINDDFMNEWEFHPALLLTYPAIRKKLDITLSPKYLLSFCKDCNDFVAINIGLAISNDLSKWSVCPEYGQLFDFGEKGHTGQFSIGISKTFGNEME